MQVFRVIVFALLAVAAVCFGLYIATGQARYQRLGLVIAKWTVLASLVFFAVLILDRLS